MFLTTLSHDQPFCIYEPNICFLFSVGFLELSHGRLPKVLIDMSADSNVACTSAYKTNKKYG